MRVLVACECSGVVRRAFRARGHDAYSCDLLPAEDESPYHWQGDVRQYLDRDWDLIIAHPPCTRLCVSGARWWAGRIDEQAEAVEFANLFWQHPCPRRAIENPIGHLSKVWGPPSQIIQPWQYGHGETKATCLWLMGLPLLVPTDVVAGREQRIHRMAPGPERARERSRTYTGVAEAMATQWGGTL